MNVGFSGGLLQKVIYSKANPQKGDMNLSKTVLIPPKQNS